jgi:hypothetical protein
MTRAFTPASRLARIQQLIRLAKLAAARLGPPMLRPANRL